MSESNKVPLSFTVPVIVGALAAGSAISNGRDVGKTIAVALVSSGVALVAILVWRLLVRR